MDEVEEEEIIITRKTQHKAADASQAPSHAADRSSQAASHAPDRSSQALSHADDRSSLGRPDFKRLIVCCDGTWLDSSRTESRSDTWIDPSAPGGSSSSIGKIVPPSNVTRLTRAIRAQSDEGIPQIVYYQAGVGSVGTIGNKVVGGISGEGLAEHVREAYSFIANNYEEGDEIFLIGFSRGAYTARSIAGLIGKLGVMTKAGLESFPVVYQDFAFRSDRRYRSAEPNVPFRNKPSASDPEYFRQLEKRRLTTLGVSIKAIGVFDTVGALGIPQLPGTGLLEKVRQAFGDTNDYQFYDTALDNCVEHAFQALALDERRNSFAPTLWERRGDNQTNLIQVWFPGVHSNVGGGYDDQELANITLAWMMAMLSPHLDLNFRYIMTQDKLNAQYYEKKDQSPRAWSFGKIVNSSSGLYQLDGQTARTPGNYHRTNPRTGEPTNKYLKDTNEFVHASVRARYNLRGPGVGDRGTYDPPALRDYRLTTEKVVAGLPTPWFWENVHDGLVLPEAPLRSVEKMLLRMTPEVEDLVLGDLPPDRRKMRR